MAKFNIPFDGVDYLVDESALAAATAVLQSHFSTVMNGSGETITLNGTSYNVDATKLSVAKNDFVSHLGTIAGNGSKVKVNGVEYPVDTAKVSDATAELHSVLGGMISGGGEEEETIAAGLYQTGSNYTVLLKPWNELVSSGAIVVNNGAVSRGTIMPEKNEYGFYYGVRYDFDGDGIVFHEDTSADLYDGDSLIESMPAGNITYSTGNIDISAMNIDVGTISSDGLSITFENGLVLAAGELTELPAELLGDLMLPTDGSITSIGNSIMGRLVVVEQPRVGFGYCTTLTGIKIPDSVTTINEGAFYKCTNLTSITIPDSVTSVGFAAFQNCPKLKTVYYEGALEQWCKITFSNSTSSPCYNYADLYIGSVKQTDITIPDTITEIKDYAFFDCTSLTSVTIPNNVTSIGGYAFYDCSNLTSITIGDGVTSIGNGAFSGCQKLTSVTIPDSVTSIGDSSFYGCISLTSVTIPDGVTSIGGSAFSNCTSLTSVTIPDSITSINSYTFSNCTNLTNVTIPNGIMKIGIEAFRNCTSLTSVIIPNSVTAFGYDAFYNCTNLTSIAFKGTIEQWNNISFPTDGGRYWNVNVPATTVQCSDGTVQL